MAETETTETLEHIKDSGGEIKIEEALPIIDRIIASHKNMKGALIPVLQSTQQLLGYLPEEVLQHISSSMKIPYSEVTGVVTFYSFFSTVPQGKHVIRVCLGTACYVRGGKQVLEAISRELDIGVGETTEDRFFSLDIGRCFGACGLAPVVMIDDTVHQRVRPDKVKELLDVYREMDAREEAETEEAEA